MLRGSSAAHPAAIARKARRSETAEQPPTRPGLEVASPPRGVRDWGEDMRVRVARIQNFRAWSPAMGPDERTSCVGMEYFCFAGDETWSLADDALVALATHELVHIGRS
jgi:hypothetical protein